MAKIDGTNGLIQQYDYQAPSTGFSYTFAAGTQVLVMQPAGTLATGTITMPASPADGMTITFSSTQTITALTVQGNTGQSITGQPTTFGAGSAATFVYRLSNTTWYPNTANANGTLTNATLVTPNINSAQVPTISGTAPLYMCRAWVNFNGTGTVAIRSSGNVTSITDNNTADYTVNFTNAMPDANYSATGLANGGANMYVKASTYAAGSFRFVTGSDSANNDATTVSIAIFR
jgi:hypothetical protein